ncbi:hypothetical protein CD798_08500 [Bacillaceae bacterium SAOS 7]|nr:hypothetical protein CD798_08500 [Bacillaceae bacterium SAOS 7]
MSNAQIFEIAFRLGGIVDPSLRRVFNSARSNLSDMDEQTAKASGSLNILGTAATVAVAGIGSLVAGLGQAVRITDEFNSSMKQIQASTGMSTEQMADMKEMSKNLYNQNLGQDWNDLAEAISITKNVTGLAGKELEGATANAIAYRDVFGEEVSQSIKATDTMMRNFGITSDQAYNLLAQGAQKGLNKSDELIDSANEYAPYFKSLGFSANQMFDTFSAGLASGAFNLDKVGDAVKEFNIRAKDGSKASTEAFQALGLDAAKMSQIFAQGGPEAKKSFQQVVQAISAIKDPVKKNEIGVALMGTQFEDLEKDVVAAMGTARSQFDMTKQTMEQIKNIKYDTFGMAIQGIGRQIETGFIIPLGEKLIPVLTTFSKSLAKAMPVIQKTAGAAFGSIGNVIASVGAKVGPALSKIPDAFQKVLPIVKPIVSAFVSFIKNIGMQVMTFWKTDGAQIMQAVQNVFSGIGAIVRVLAPPVLFIINMVWTSVKGVIQGALNVVMGLIRVFSGLFTGDWAKMWQGVKQIFIGAIQFIWNFMSLMVVGRLVQIVKIGVTGMLTHFRYLWALGKDIFKKLWDDVAKFFSAGVKNAISKVQNMWNQARTIFSMLRQFGDNIFMALWNTIRSMMTNITSSVSRGFMTMKNRATTLIDTLKTNVTSRFNSIVEAAKALPGKIGSGISSMAGKAVEGVTKLGNKMLRAIGRMVNGVIKGLNWIMGKVGVDMSLGTWTVPQYAKGTKGHPGGPAILGDGGGPELFRTPKGHVGLSPGTDTLMNLPKGTQVIPARETSQILSMYNIPAYKNGNILGNALETGKEWLSDKASDVKDIALDVFSYISEPSKLLNKVLTEFGVGVPKIGGIFGKVASGAFTMIKDKAVTYLTSKLPQMSAQAGPGFGPPFRVTSRFGRRFHPVDKVWKNHNGIDYAAPMGTPIPSQSAGKVSFSGWRGGYGNAVMVNSAGGYTHLYGHNSKNLVRVGQGVSPGTILGLVGSTGKSTGPHVHYEVRRNGTPVDPNSVGGAGSIPGGKISGSLSSWIRAGMARAGVSGSNWLNGLAWIINKESSGNPKAVGAMTSSGTAKGLMQLKDFNYRGNPFDPVNNIFYGIKYILGRYKGIDGALSWWRKHNWYANGTNFHQGGPAVVNDGNGPELIRFPSGAFGMFKGKNVLADLPRGTKVFNNGETKSMLSGILSFTGQTGNSSPSLKQTSHEQPEQIVYSPHFIIEGNADEAILNKALSLGFEHFKQWYKQMEEEKERKTQLSY